MAFFDDELRKLQQQRAQLDAYDQAQQAALDYENKARAAQEAQSRQSQGGLGGVLAGIGNSINNLGKGLVGMFGTGGAAIGDIFSSIGSGKVTTKNQDDFNKWLAGTENKKDAYAKNAGAAIDAAATLSDFIPGLGTGAKVALNVGQGAASGVAQELIDNGANASLDNALKNVTAGAAAAGAGQFVGNKLAKGVGGNGRIAKAINSNLGRGALTGAAAGAVGGGLGTALNGGDLGQTLSGALQGAGGGALGGATMAGVMGLAGTGIDKLNQKVAGAPTAQNIPEAPVKQRVIETETTPTRKGIAITDYDAGEQPITVRRANAQSNEYNLGKNAGSLIDGVLGPDNDIQLKNAKRPTDTSLFKKMTGGDFDNAADMLAKNPGDLELLKNTNRDLYNRILEGARDYSDLNALQFDGTGAGNKSSLPELNRQQYYEDTIGKLHNQTALGETSTSAADVPDYMRSHLVNDTTGELNGRTLKNDDILREFFRGREGDAVDSMDLNELYGKYEALAQAANQNEIYTPENISNGMRMNGLNDEATRAYLERFGARQNIDVDQYPSLRKPVEVGIETPASDETVYTKRILNAQAQENPVARQTVATPEPETQLIQKGTPEYNEFVRQENIANRQRELRRDIVNGIRDQYGTTRLNDRINGLNDAIMEVADLGLTKRSQIDGFANRITGRDGEVPRVIRKSLKNGGDVNGRVDITMDDVYRSAGADKAAQGRIKSFFETTGKKYSVDQNGNMNRLDMYDFGKELEKEAYKMIDRGDRTQNATTTAYGEGLRLLGEAYISKATDGVDVKSNINVNKLKNILPGNDKWAAKVDDFVNNAETVQDLRSFIEAPTKMSLLAQAEEYNQGTYGQRGGDLGRDAGRAFRAGTSANPAVALGQIALEKAIDSDAGQQARINRALKNYQNIEAGGTGKTGAINTVKNVAGAIGDKIGNAASALNNDTFSGRAISPIRRTTDNGVYTNTIGDIATSQIARQAGKAAVNDTNIANEQANAQNALTEAQNAYNTAVGNYQNVVAQGQQLEQQMSQGAQQLQRISSAMDAALAAGDIASYGKLADLYQQAYKIYGADATAGTTEAKALSANQSKALAAQQQLEQLATMRPDAGTAMADIPVLSNLIGLTGGNEYANQAKALATTLGYLLSGANIKESEAERIGQSYVPNAYDSEAVRQQKLARARQLIQSYMGDTNDLAQA